MAQAGELMAFKISAFIFACASRTSTCAGFLLFCLLHFNSERGALLKCALGVTMCGNE